MAEKIRYVRPRCKVHRVGRCNAGNERKCAAWSDVITIRDWFFFLPITELDSAHNHNRKNTAQYRQKTRTWPRFSCMPHGLCPLHESRQSLYLLCGCQCQDTIRFHSRLHDLLGSMLQDLPTKSREQRQQTNFRHASCLCLSTSRAGFLICYMICPFTKIPFTRAGRRGLVRTLRGARRPLQRCIARPWSQWPPALPGTPSACQSSPGEETGGERERGKWGHK